MTSPPIIRLIDELNKPSAKVEWVLELARQLKSEGDLASPTVAATDAKRLGPKGESPTAESRGRPNLILQGLQRG
jgi:hypothetical protein